MAAEEKARDKGPKRKRKGGAPPAGGKPAAAGKAAHATGRAEPVALRQIDSPRSERRYEPRATPQAIVSVLLASIGVVALGAGSYAQWLHGWIRGEAEPHRLAAYAPVILAAGAIVLLGILLFGVRPAHPIRVGDAGVAVEKNAAEIDRIGWHQVTSLLLADDILTIQASGRSITLPLLVHREAAGRALAEARRRIPAIAADVEGSIEPLDDAAGEVLEIEPVQVAGLRCKATHKAISFEKDARLCGRCGEVYHKDAVPPQCVTCGARLRS